MEDDLAYGQAAMPQRTWSSVPYLNRPWHYLAWGVGIYGGLVLVGYMFPPRARNVHRSPKLALPSLLQLQSRLQQLQLPFDRHP